MMEFPYAEKICRAVNPLDWDDMKMSDFREACREMAVFHCGHSPDIASLYGRYGFDPRSIRTEADLLRIPAVGVTAMKHFLLTSLPHEKAVLKLTSSGTKGQKTQIWFDQRSLDRVQAMMDGYFEQEGLVSGKPANYLVFNYDPDDAGDLGIAYTEKNQLRFAPVNRVFFAIKKNPSGQWVFQKEKALEYLRSYNEEKLPVRIFAMPAFLFEFLEFMRDQNAGPLAFPDNSWILTGGGWKAAEDKQVSRSQFRGMCAGQFGISEEFQRDGYGMAEHCAPYFECRRHRFHIAVYNRLIMRDPVTYKQVPDGQPGLLELLTPFNAMMPTLAILSTDYGRILPDKCDCGYNSPAFEILGRAGVSKHKGCAIAASEIVRR